MRPRPARARRDAARTAAVRCQVMLALKLAQARDGLVARLDYRDERGDIAPRTVGIAVMAGIALTIGSIIAAKLEAKANALNLGE